MSFSDTSPNEFVTKFYGHDKSDNDVDKTEIQTNAPWRRIDNDWLFSAENLALKLNSGINNTSLVLAFELPLSKKILLFAGDAQRGNWVSWTDNEWGTKDDKITVRDLLSRTVLYKVAHHASHNATLAGSTEDKHPNLSWMAGGKCASEFSAMITAVNQWAMTKNDPPWRHPLPSILKALEEKTGGRIFQTDKESLKKQKDTSDSSWADFMERSTVNDLYFDYVIKDIPL